MQVYVPPLDDMRFVMAHIAGGDDVASLPGLGHCTADLRDAVLGEAGRFAAGRAGAAQCIRRP